MNISSTNHSILITQVFALIACSHILRRVLRPYALPAVVAELLTGILLGPSCFGYLFPDQQAWFFPKAETSGLAALAQIGSLLLLIVTGLEIDRKRIHGFRVCALSLGGIIVPFSIGFFIAPFLLQSQIQDKFIFSLFIATAMSISAVSVMAKIFIDLKMSQSRIAQLALPAAMTDDAVGWILLSFITSVATYKTFSMLTLFQSAYTIIGFVVAILYFGPYITAYFFRLSSNKIAACITICTTMAAFATLLKIEPILGAFVTALVQPQEIKNEVKPVLEKLISSIFAPIFFASAGLKVDLTVIKSFDILKVTITILAIACIGKILGAYLGARMINLEHSESLAIGWAMNARGSQEIIIASIGLGLHIIPQSIYTGIIVMSVLTSLIAAPMLKRSLGALSPC